jgi:hypothetical protein
VVLPVIVEELDEWVEAEVLEVVEVSEVEVVLVLEGCDDVWVELLLVVVTVDCELDADDFVLLCEVVELGEDCELVAWLLVLGVECVVREDVLVPVLELELEDVLLPESARYAPTPTTATITITSSAITAVPIAGLLSNFKTRRYLTAEDGEYKTLTAGRTDSDSVGR